VPHVLLPVVARSLPLAFLLLSLICFLLLEADVPCPQRDRVCLPSVLQLFPPPSEGRDRFILFLLRTLPRARARFLRVPTRRSFSFSDCFLSLPPILPPFFRCGAAHDRLLLRLKFLRVSCSRGSRPRQPPPTTFPRFLSYRRFFAESPLYFLPGRVASE